MLFKNPQNGYVEVATTGVSWLWAFLWSPIYYAVKGIWTHAIVSFILSLGLAPFTFGVASIVVGVVYAIMNNNIVRGHYLKRGWVEVKLDSLAVESQAE